MRFLTLVVRAHAAWLLSGNEEFSHFSTVTFLHTFRANLERNIIPGIDCSSTINVEIDGPLTPMQLEEAVSLTCRLIFYQDNIV